MNPITLRALVDELEKLAAITRPGQKPLKRPLGGASEGGVALNTTVPAGGASARS
jgi:hypothetical protein